MPLVDKTLRTISCDAPECKNAVTFDVQNQEEISKLPDWLRTYRNVVLGNNTRFGYCSDVCEVEGVTTGVHNIPEPKKIQEGTALEQQRAIAEAAVAQAMKAKTDGKVSLE